MEDQEERQLIWLCEDCQAEAPPNKSGFLQLNLHAKGHHIGLVDVDTGEILAKTWGEAVQKSILSPEEKEKGKKVKVREPEEGTEFAITKDFETWFPVKMYLPSRIFDLFRTLKGVPGLCDHADIGEFMVQYTEYGVQQAHGVNLTLAPIVQEKSSDERIDRLENMFAQFLERIDGKEKEPKKEKEKAKVVK